MLNSLRGYFADIRFKKSIYTTAITNILLVYAIFSISRVLFYLFNANYFPNVTFGGFMWMMLGGLKFDTSGILYTNLFYLVLILLPFLVM